MLREVDFGAGDLIRTDMSCASPARASARPELLRNAGQRPGAHRYVPRQRTRAGGTTIATHAESLGE